MRESTFKTSFMKKFLKRMEELDIPIIDLDIDPILNRSKPDKLILGPNTWAALEFKRRVDADRQPNQPYYVELMEDMSFGAFVYPANGDDILEALVDHFSQ